jgi:hypothetical protein
MQIIAKGDQGDFDLIFRYQSINWLTGDVSEGINPGVGFDAYDGVHYYNALGSLTAAMGNLETVSNTTPAMPGTLIFHIDHTTMAGGADTLNGGAGDDILIGGAGDDLFVFHPGDGKDIIRDFVPGPTGGHDTIQLLGYGSGLDSFAEVMSHAAQVGGNVVITIDASNSITLEGVTLSQLNAADFLFS